MKRRLSAVLAASALSTAAVAAPDITTLIATPTATAGAVEFELLFANAGSEPATFEAPAAIDAELGQAGRTTAVALTRVEAEPPGGVALAPGAFRRVRYRAALPAGLPGGALATLSAPSLRSNVAAVVLPQGAAPTALAAAEPAAGPLAPATDAAPPGDRGNAFVAGLSAYEPIYAVAGTGPDTNAKLQFSFKYQLFGDQGAFRSKRSWLDGIHFAYTQRIFWDIGAESAPFRNVDYQPELIYLLQTPPRTEGVRWGLQGGLRHESNGREGELSRSVNTAYLQPMATIPIGRFDLSVGPRAWFYFGGQKGNEDIERFRGYTGLALDLGEADGLRVATLSRYNFGTGKGSAQADVTYPLGRLIFEDLNLYLMGQAFVGYGENLLDYNRHSTRLRLGIAIVR